ncbi:hypothetical protein GCM10027261_34060 [Geodermatophilus arenarius]
MSPRELLHTAYEDLTRVLLTLTRAERWAPTGCTGRAVVD